MMLIQLQLSTVNSSSNGVKRSRPSSNPGHHTHHHHHHHHNPPTISQSQQVYSTPAHHCPSDHAAKTPAATPNPTGTTAAPTPASVPASSQATCSSGQEAPLPSNSTPAASDPYKPKLDTRALTEASKNLTKTLRQLSSEVLTTKCEEVRL